MGEIKNIVIQITSLITIFVIVIISLTLLTPLMNEAEQAKANPNVTDAQSIFIDLTGLFWIIALALLVFASSLVAQKIEY